MQTINHTFQLLIVMMTTKFLLQNLPLKLQLLVLLALICHLPVAEVVRVLTSSTILRMHLTLTLRGHAIWTALIDLCRILNSWHSLNRFGMLSR